MTLTYSTNIVIFGGGIAGLWLLNRMQNEGYRPILFETEALGGRQTLSSQGIIHGGLKYALSGSLNKAAQTAASMPSRWRQCLNGNGEVDLTGVKLLNEHYYMWSHGGLRSKLKSYLGSKSLRGKVTSLPKDSYPAFFSKSSVNGTLYQLPDFVLDTESLLRKLVSKSPERIFSLKNCKYNFSSEENASKQRLEVIIGNKKIVIDAELFIFCAGEGNTELINKASLSSIKSQTRPLHMVYLRNPDLPRIHVHCIGNSFNLNPSLTITSHEAKNGDIIWYLGGDIAESGIKRSKGEQIKTAEKLIMKTFPWFQISGANWKSFFINRSEADVQNNYRPDDAVVKSEENILVAWPTKLTLVPSLADKVLTKMAESGMAPQRKDDSLNELQSVFNRPSLAKAYWD